ncbi:LysR substrate-binding domain-containing protein [Shewanella sp. MBTL60-007]|uniref:LysR substrate-binding domain-containing protein n=1 Tax=Shewanella sp. MBTL60-007 TaxID=2815911 RepID=UPI001BC28882|nr:LysR substrate-binding domain-containing protein [Shewanella sp. MBTL60-007]GIU18306.1 LysR family transcriptional regulator [Shewanella sp. MBTL60-007]
MRRLPPLNPLRAFESAARHEHFSRAADELCVTHSAISHQVKTLEDALGIKLFEKQGRNAKLTQSGANLLPAIQEAFDIIGQACEKAVEPGLSGRLVISAPPELSSKWLIKQIGDFAIRYPSIDVSLLVHTSDETNINPQADLSIIYGAGDADWNRYWVTPIKGMEFFPVCSPKLLQLDKNSGLDAKQEGGLPLDLSAQRLLHDDQDGKTWATWLGAHAPHILNTPQNLNFAHAGLSLEAAIAGYGVAIGDNFTASTELESGKLVRPFEQSVPSLGNYYLVAEKRKKGDVKLMTFINWLLTQINNKFSTESSSN